MRRSRGQSSTSSDAAGLRMDLNLLNVFDVVMVERHVTRAAERLGMTQSATSNALNRLRIAIGDQLFVKVARGVDPTPRALELWPRIHESILELNAGLQPHAFDPAQTRQRFRISIVDLMASLLAPQLHKDLSVLAPHATLHFLPHEEELAASYLTRSEVDLAIGMRTPRLSILQAMPLWSEPYVMAARRSHPLLTRPLTLADFCAAPHVVVNMIGSPDFETAIDTALAARGMKRNIKLSVNQFSVATTVLLESDLVAVMPTRFATTPYARGQIDVRPLPLPVPDAHLYLSWHRRNNGVAAHEWLKAQVLRSTDKLRADVERLVRRKGAAKRQSGR